MDPPIKQGQTRYPFLIMLFNKEDETTLELGLTEWVGKKQLVIKDYESFIPSSGRYLPAWDGNKTLIMLIP